MIEPGVTYTQFQSEAKKKGLRPMMTLLPRKNKSVIAMHGTVIATHGFVIDERNREVSPESLK